MIFPSFARARENARRSSCQSNMKQLGLAFMQYTQDYDERLPLVTAGSGQAGVVAGWTYYFRSYKRRVPLPHPKAAFTRTSKVCRFSFVLPIARASRGGNRTQLTLAFSPRMQLRPLAQEKCWRPLMKPRNGCYLTKNPIPAAQPTKPPAPLTMATSTNSKKTTSQPATSKAPTYYSWMDTSNSIAQHKRGRAALLSAERVRPHAEPLALKLTQRLHISRRRASGDSSRTPAPLEVVAAQPAVYIAYLTREEQAFVQFAHHRGRFDFIQ